MCLTPTPSTVFFFAALLRITHRVFVSEMVCAFLESVEYFLSGYLLEVVTCRRAEASVCSFLLMFTSLSFFFIFI